ncbi:hypothetical protein J6590_024138 [Homalodisca vitripennis]|nr:hypothetical protein J6590_024138 [Homalodisca vitripennis]
MRSDDSVRADTGIGSVFAEHLSQILPQDNPCNCNSKDSLADPTSEEAIKPLQGSKDSANGLPQTSHIAEVDWPVTSSAIPALMGHQPTGMKEIGGIV